MHIKRFCEHFGDAMSQIGDIKLRFIKDALEKFIT